MPDQKTFPDAFSDLEKYAGYALATQNTRYEKRLEQPFSELKQVHEALFKRLPDMLDYLDTCGPPDSFNEPDAALMNLTLMVAASGVAVERLGARSIENTIDVMRFKPYGF